MKNIYEKKDLQSTNLYRLLGIFCAVPRFKTMSPEHPVTVDLLKSIADGAMELMDKTI